MIDQIAKVFAAAMWDAIIASVPVGPKLRQEIPEMARRGDCRAILNRCRNLPPRRPTGPAIEDVLPELERIYGLYEKVVDVIE